MMGTNAEGEFLLYRSLAEKEETNRRVRLLRRAISDVARERAADARKGGNAGNAQKAKSTA
jgi:hypothetical protein